MTDFMAPPIAVQDDQQNTFYQFSYAPYLEVSYDVSDKEVTLTGYIYHFKKRYNYETHTYDLILNHGSWRPIPQNQVSSKSRFGFTTHLSGNHINGVEDRDHLQFSLYPNPSEGLYHVQWNMTESSNEPTVYNIVDLTGKTVQTGSFMTVSTRSHQIDLSHLPSGIYHLHLSHNHVESFHKLIKN